MKPLQAQFPGAGRAATFQPSSQPGTTASRSPRKSPRRQSPTDMACDNQVEQNMLCTFTLFSSAYLTDTLERFYSRDISTQICKLVVI